MRRCRRWAIIASFASVSGCFPQDREICHDCEEDGGTASDAGPSPRSDGGPGADGGTNNRHVIDLDLFLASVPDFTESPLEDCVRGAVESFENGEAKGWVVNACALRNDTRNIESSGILLYLEEVSAKSGVPSMPAARYVPAARSTVPLRDPNDVLADDDPTPFIAALANMPRRIKVAGNESEAPIGFSIPVSSFVKSARLLRLRGVSTEDADSWIQSERTSERHVYSPIESLEIDFEAANPTDNLLDREGWAALGTIPTHEVFAPEPGGYGIDQAPIVIPVSFYVIRRDDGSGNDIWTEELCRVGLRRANHYMLGYVEYRLKLVTDIEDTETFDNADLGQITDDWWLGGPNYDLRPYGELTIVVKGNAPGNDEWATGVSWIEFMYNPSFGVAPDIRPYDNAQHGFDIVDYLGGVISHEAGHQRHLRDDGKGIEYFRQEPGSDCHSTWLADMTYWARRLAWCRGKSDDFPECERAYGDAFRLDMTACDPSNPTGVQPPNEPADF